LKDIPVLGALFGSTNRTDVQTELFLFLTPHIISTDEDADRLRREIERGADLLKLQLPEERTILPRGLPEPDSPR
ncbi:MAG: secretion protein, partial [Longimicrobiales bacterium]